MDNAQLIKNLTKRNIPNALILFVANMIKDRKTVLRFNGYTFNAIT